MRVAAIRVLVAALFILPLVPGLSAAQDVLASRQWEVKQTVGHYDNRPQEVLFSLGASGVIQTVEDVQPFCGCGTVGWQYFVAQHRRRGASEWVTGWPREAADTNRTCQDEIEGKPYRCTGTRTLSPGAENYQMRILMRPNHYRDGLDIRTPEQVLAIAVKYIAQGQAGPATPGPGKAGLSLPSAATIAAGGSFVDRLKSGRLLTGEAGETRGSQPGRTWPFQIRLVSYDASTGSFVGELTWSSLSSVNRIRGRLDGTSLTFTEVEAIRAGSAHLNVGYTMTVSESGATGTWIDPADKSTGTISIPGR